MKRGVCGLLVFIASSVLAQTERGVVVFGSWENRAYLEVYQVELEETLGIATDVSQINLGGRSIFRLTSMPLREEEARVLQAGAKNLGVVGWYLRLKDISKSSVETSLGEVRLHDTKVDPVVDKKQPATFGLATLRLPKRNVYSGSAKSQLGFGSILDWSESFDVRAKWFTAVGALPSENYQRQLGGTPTIDNSADLRLMFKREFGPLGIEIDHSTNWTRGDAIGLALNESMTLDQTPSTDDSRIFDLTWPISDSEKQRTIHRFDRLAFEYRKGSTAVTIGRQAVSWGSGFVFNPLDLFNPFAPTTVDTDYKSGDDLLSVEHLFANGSDLQILGVGHRVGGELDGSSSSFGAKWHGFWGISELEFVLARHFEDEILGAMLRVPIGGAMIRSDLVGNRTKEGDWYYSGIVNADYSFGLFDRMAYVFMEYFHNDFGVRELDEDGVILPQALSERLNRGELFNLMRDYVALGATYQWHPLLVQSTSVIVNLQDKSTLLQTSLSFDPGDHSRLELGFVASLGEEGKEFGGIPISPGITAGGGFRGFFRWVYFL